MFSRFLSVAVVVCAMLGLAFTGLNTANATVNFCINPGFEIADVVAGLPGPYGANTAHPWSYWANGHASNINCDPLNPQAAIANPFPGAANNSPRVWANFNNPFYVNVASQNNFTYSGDPAGLRRPLTGFVLIPGVKYTFTGQFYVPSSQMILGTTTARAGMYLSMAGSGTTPPQPTMLRALDPRYYENAGVEPPLPIFVPQQSPVSPNITLDQWNTFNVDYVFPTTWNTFDANGQVTGTYNTVPQIVNYPSFRIFGGDGSRYLGIAAGTAPAKPLVDVPNPGGYFDNCQISSDDYRGDLHGFVKDDSGNPIEGATVTLTSPFRTEKDVVTTLADGSYTLPTWAPHGYTFSVNAAYGTYTSDGPKDLAVSSTAGQFPQITMTPARTYWDTNGSAPGIGGDGTWYDGCMNFSTNLDGTGGGVAQGSGKVVFGGTVGAVGISGTVSANAGLQFSTTLYTVSGGTLTLGGANAAANTITTDPGVTATITATLGGENGMTKAGTGTLVLGTSTEPVTNGYTGGTIVSAGTLQIGSAGALPAGQALTIAAGATVVLSSGLSAAGANGAATSATAVPEPGTIALLTAGLAGLLVVAWRRGRRR